MVFIRRDEGYWRAYFKVARAGLISLALMLCAATSNPPAPSGGDTQAQHQSAASQKHTNTQTSQNALPKPILIEIDQPPDVKPIATEAKDERQWYAVPDWWVAGFTGLLFTATAGLWIFTGLMWKATTKVAADGENAIKAANRSAKAAEGVLAHNEKTTRSELRAYVGIDLNSETARIEVSPSDRSISVKVLVRNFGRTPAFKLQVSSKIEVREKPLIGRLLKDIAPTSQSTVTLNPEQTIFVTEEAKEIVISPEDSREIVKASKAIYFSGRIEFTDIFKKPRWVDFAMYSHEGNGGDASFWLCETGNSTSEENEPE